MPDSLQKIIDFCWPICIGAAFAWACSRFGYFWDKDDKLEPALRERVRQTLDRVFPADDSAGLFLSFFDNLFDPGGTGRPSLTRSVLASFLVLIVLAVAWALSWPGRAESIFTDLVEGTLRELLDSIMILTLLAVGTNCIGDFFSLWETRFMMGRVAIARGRRRAILLLSDLVATVLIYGSGVVFGSLLFMAFAELRAFEYIPSLSVIILHILTVVFIVFDTLVVDQGLLFCDPENDFLSIFFYTTLFTSVWAWVFMLGIKLWPLFARMLRETLNVNQYPVGSAMTIGGIFIGLVISFVGYVWKLFQLGTC